MIHNTVMQKSAFKGKASIRGFTLIEIMIVVAIIAIIATIAMPSYRRYIIKSAESDVQAVMQNQAVQLKRWRAKALNYKGYEIDTTTTSNNFIYVPNGSTATDYRYKITLVDAGDTSKALNNNSATGQAWVMLAEPNSSGTFSKANTYLMKSDGSRCYVDHTLSLTVASDCTGSGAKSW